jgi:hypothetical protein
MGGELSVFGVVDSTAPFEEFWQWGRVLAVDAQHARLIAAWTPLKTAPPPPLKKTRTQCG